MLSQTSPSLPPAPAKLEPCSHCSSSPELAFVSKECWTLEDLLPLTRLSRLDYEPARVMSAPKPKVTSEGAFSAILQISLEES